MASLYCLQVLVALISLQVAQEGEPLVGVDPATSPPDRTASASVVTQPQAPGTINPLELARREALRNFRALNFTALDGDGWTYVAIYYGVRVAFVVLLMILAWTLSGWASTAMQAALTRVRFDRTLTLFVARLVRWLILLMVVLTCLGYFGIQTTSFAAVIGAAGLAIGLAFQGTLSNFAAGAMLLIFRPYKVGDVVNVAGHLGTVGEIELFTTTIDTLDRRRVFVPNSSIYGSVIENITYHPVRRIDLPIWTACAADIDATRAALERAARSATDVLETPAPEAVLSGLGSSGVEWSVRAFARREQFLAVKQALVRAVKIELDRSGIPISFPQMDVHLDRLPAARRRVA